MKHLIGLDLVGLVLGLAVAIALERYRRKVERLTMKLSRATFECAVTGARLEAMEMLFREKQAKINRLQGAIRAGVRVDVGDLVPERHLRSVSDAVREVSEDFDRRQLEYEQSGDYRRRTDRFTEEEGPPDAA